MVDTFLLETLKGYALYTTHISPLKTLSIAVTSTTEHLDSVLTLHIIKHFCITPITH